MAVTQHKAKRKISGGRYKKISKKSRYLGSLPTLTKIGKLKTKKVRTRGRNQKIRLLKVETANVYSPKDKKYYKLKIEGIEDNPANRHFIRRGILTKGAVIKTSKGNAKIISRPGQETSLNAILL